MKVVFRSACLVFTVLLLFSSYAAQTLATIEREMLGHLGNISKYGTYGGSYDDNKVDAENRALKEKLIRSSKRADVLTYSFPRLKKEMFVSTSKDGNLRIYSWDEQVGGTMHDYDSVFQYRGSNGKVLSWTVDEVADEDIGGFYHDIFQLNTNKGPIYLAVSTFIASTSLAAQSIEILTIQGNRLDREAKLIRTGSGLQNSVDFQYDFFTVVDRPERPIKLFKFDEASRTFSFPVVIEDEKTPQGRVTNKFIRYRFNGTYFEKVS